MDLRRDDLKRIARAPAKLNLFLDLLGRREDGFHEVETVMVPIRLADTVSFQSVSHDISERPGAIRLEVRGVPSRAEQNATAIPTGPENLIVRALGLLKKRSGCELGARVELVKRIPAAAGLGGGSSDAAAALRLANRGWQIHWTEDRLGELAAEVGSDVPFFLTGGAAICRGRGERVVRLPPVSPVHVVIVKPPVGLGTGDVYRAYDGLPENRRRVSLSGGSFELVHSLASGSAAELGRRLRNVLQNAASLLSPWVDKLKMAFGELDFAGCQLSGSGSAYFGVCRHAQHARRLASILRTRQLGLVYATRSCQ
jgi:4-diphosphocytidyl-2-C-methyl-D-erythritol kinase